jgi:hypothetical protein
MRKSLGSRARNGSIEELAASRTVVVGSPKTVRERTRLNVLVSMLKFGVMADEYAKRNMELFAAEAVAHFRD